MRHAWTAMVEIPLTENEAAEMMKTGQLNLDYYKKQQEVSVGCYRCELALPQAWGKPCEGEPVYATPDQQGEQTR